MTNMKDTACIIPLTQGKFATVSSEDYEFIMEWKWWANKSRTSYGYRWYAARTAPGRKHVSMHREIAKRAGLPEARDYDHKDRDGLNNTRGNIRPSTRSQNIANSTKAEGKSSHFKGVAWHKASRKWQACIKVEYKFIYLGVFEKEGDAAQAYLLAAKRYFGEFAHSSELPAKSG